MRILKAHPKSVSSTTELVDSPPSSAETVEYELVDSPPSSAETAEYEIVDAPIRKHTKPPPPRGNKKRSNVVPRPESLPHLGNSHHVQERPNLLHLLKGNGQCFKYGNIDKAGEARGGVSAKPGEARGGVYTGVLRLRLRSPFVELERFPERGRL